MDPHEFEDEVRRVARQLWPDARYGGAEIVEGRERDGIFTTEEMTHVLEATTSRTKEKAVNDIGKTQKEVTRLRRKGQNAQGWFVTLSEPTADQRGAAPADRSVHVVSFDQFRKRLIDASDYLSLRDNYSFGSARDPSTGAVNLSQPYFPLRLEKRTPVQESVSIEDLASQIIQGQKLVLMGDYGAGKSMTMRELHMRLARNYRSGSVQFPIHLNLRDHHGQMDPAEALERHAKQVGLWRPDHLVRAWRGGVASVLLDGFDEIGSSGWSGSTKRMAEVRRASVGLIRAFVRETPSDVGLCIAGRAQFFDSIAELRNAFAVAATVGEVLIGELDDVQITDYVKGEGWEGHLPDWVPAKPLLLSYLVSSGALQVIEDLPANGGPAKGWNMLLDRVAAREAEIEANVDGHTLRRVTERLATVARRAQDGTGPLDATDIDGAFRSVIGDLPDDRGQVLLRRLPGIGPTDEQSGTRSFVDDTVADVARTGDVYRFVVQPFADEIVDWKGIRAGIGALGLQVLAYRLESDGLLDKVPIAFSTAIQRGWSLLASDLLGSLLVAQADEVVKLKGAIDDVWLLGLDLSECVADLSELGFVGSFIEQLDLCAHVTVTRWPSFDDCVIERVVGVSRGMVEESGRFRGCDIGDVESTDLTTAALLSLDRSPGERVGLTMLKKLYLQSGTGRQESALVRGLGGKERELANRVLQVLEKQGFCRRLKVGRQQVWQPLRSERVRAMQLVDGTVRSGDEALSELAAL